MLFFFVFLTALVISMSLVPPLTWAAQRLSIVDVPNERKVHACVIPRIGGIAMIVGMLVPLLMWLPLTQEYAATLLGVAVILFFGVWDDRAELSPKAKFLGQFIAVLIVVMGGGVVIDRLPFAGFDALPMWFAVPFTVFALMGVTNAVNLADGLDGLAGGTTLLSFAGVAALAYLAGGNELTLFCLAVGGALLGFLRYNTWPAQIFMGDAGSQFLGFSLGVAVILLIKDVQSAASPMVALFLIGLPILDTALVMAHRIRERRSPFSPDRNHLHHRLLELDLDHYEAVLIIYVVQALLVGLGVFLRYESDVLLVVIYAAFVAGASLFCRLRGRKLRRGVEPSVHVSVLSRFVQWLRVTGWSARGPLIWANVSVASLFVLVAVSARDVPGEFGIYAWLLFAAMAIAVVQRRYPLRWVEQIVLYCTSVFVVYVLTTAANLQEGFRTFTDFYLLLLAVVVMVGIRFTRGRNFRVTPLDFLVLFLVMVVPTVGQGRFHDIGMAAAKLVVMLYAVEFVFGLAKSSPWMLRAATLSSLAVFGLKSLT